MMPNAPRALTDVFKWLYLSDQQSWANSVEFSLLNKNIRVSTLDFGQSVYAHSFVVKINLNVTLTPISLC